MKLQLLCTALTVCLFGWSQQAPVNCNLAVSGCSTPQFPIVGQNPPYNTVDFVTGSTSNPSSNPGSGNLGCLLTGETVSTFITINVVSNGTLEWSFVGLNASGTPSESGCFDWIMWNVSTQPVTNPCAGINGNTLAPVRCNWNGNCNGNTGMAPAGNLPPDGDPSSYEPPLTVTAGQTFILCLSNYSGTNQNVDLDFFGSALVVCGVSAADQTICLGSSAIVNIATPGYTSPTFQWLVTNGVSNPAGGSNVVVTPTVTTLYKVKVSQPAIGPNPPLTDTAEFTITVVPPPTPNAGPDQVVCFGMPFQLHGVPSSAANTANWQVIVPVTTPPSTASVSPNFSNMNPTITVNQPGIYKFVLRETSTVCGMVRDTIVVNVSELAVAATPTPPSCVGYADGQISIASAGAVQYSYDNGINWSPSSTMGGFSAGTYSVCARNASGCQKCVSVTLVDPAPVVISVSNDTLICQNGTASISASAIGGTTYDFHWNHTASTAAAQDVLPVTATYYPVFATSESGCVSAPDSVYVTVRAPISATITPDQFVCPGYPGSMTATASEGIGAPYTYTWSTDTIHTAAVSTLTQSPLVTTTYTVIINDACESTPFTISTQLITHPLPVPAIDVDEHVKCEPAVFTITNSTIASTMAGNYWRLSDGQEFTNTPVIVPDDLYAGTYDVTLVVVSPEGCIDSTTFQNFLIVKPQPLADFRWSPDPVMMFNTEVLFTNYSTGADTYQWSFQDAVPYASTSEDVVATFPDGVTGYYEVTLIATSDLGCIDTVTKIVPVMPEVLLYAPNAFTPDGDEFNQSWKVHMEGIDLYDFQLLIFNRWGEVIWESHDLEASWDGTYKGEVLPGGTYKWTIQTGDRLNDASYRYTGDVIIIR